MGFAGSRRPVTTEDRFRFQTILYGITGGQSGTLTGFLLSTLYFSCQHHSASSPCLHFIPLPTTLFNRGGHNVVFYSHAAGAQQRCGSRNLPVQEMIFR
jgi:hypothetical protein